MKLYRVSFTNRRPITVRADHLTAAVEVARGWIAKLGTSGPWDITKVSYLGQDSEVVEITTEPAAKKGPAQTPPTTGPSAKERRRAERAADPVVQAQAKVHLALRDLITLTKEAATPETKES